MTFRISFPVCQNCGKRMRIIRRGVRRDQDGYFERQEFICDPCSLLIERKIKTDGTVLSSVPMQQVSTKAPMR